MTKSDLIDIVAKKAHLTKKAANDAVESSLDEVMRSLKKGEKVVLSGFGTFYLGKVKDKQVVPFGRRKSADHQRTPRGELPRWKTVQKTVW